MLLEKGIKISLSCSYITFFSLQCEYSSPCASLFSFCSSLLSYSFAPSFIFFPSFLYFHQSFLPSGLFLSCVSAAIEASYICSGSFHPTPQAEVRCVYVSFSVLLSFTNRSGYFSPIHFFLSFLSLSFL